MSEVLIIGGGIAGLCTAYYCAQAGAKVTVIERESHDHKGCSYGNAGMIVPSHFVPLAAPGMVALGLKWMWNSTSPFYIKPRLDADLLGWALRFWRAATPDHVNRSAPLLRDLHFASRACFEEMAEMTRNDFGLVKYGLLMLCKTDHALSEEIKSAQRAREFGVPAEILDPSETASLDPNVRMEIAGSVYFPNDCHLTPERFMNSLKQQLQKLRVKIEYETEITGWHVMGGRIQAARTSREDFQADEYVLCGGSWSPGIARGLQLKLPMQAGKGYSLTLRHPRQLPSICAIFAEARVAATPMGSTLRFGGTMEIVGINEEINWRRVYGIIDAVSKYYPDFVGTDFDEITPWCGLRPCSPDGLPYIGRTAAYRNLSIATGHSMMGLSLGPITGKLIAQIIEGEKPAFDLQLLSPDRYA